MMRYVFFILSFILALETHLTLAAEPPSGGGPDSAPPSDSGKNSESRTLKPEEDDFSGTPFTEYGEFNEAEDEETDTKFFQFGRFFGVSLGGGFQTVTGNRGALWQGGFPVVDLKLHYWFDFNLALDLGFYTAQHFFDTTAAIYNGHVDVNWFSVFVDVKYYLDTRNLSSAITFASPYVILGFGSFSKTQNSLLQGDQGSDTSIGVNFGAGLEFTLSPRKTYFELEAKAHTVTFRDTYTTDFGSVGLTNLTGLFITVTGSVLFTW